MPKRKHIDQDNNQIGIRKGDVPNYLRSGALYQSFGDDNNDEIIMVPKGAVKSNDKVKSLSQANHLFESLRFWIVEDIPVSFVHFVLTQPRSIMPDAEFWNKFDNEFPWLKYMKKCANPYIKRSTTKMEHILPSGNMELVKAAYDKLQCMPTHACDYAVCTGSINKLQLIHSLCDFKPSSQGVCYRALYHCEDETLLAAAHALGYALGGSRSTSAAARMGKLSCLKYLHEHGCCWNSNVTRYSVQSNFPECLKYALEHGCPRDRYICCDAAEYGYLLCLQYAHESACAWGELVPSLAAVNGHLSCLQYAKEHGCPLRYNICDEVARRGQLSCLQYLHEQGCFCNERTCAMAACEGHLDCLQYLHEHGCPWDASVCATAAGGNQLPCLQYLHEHGCPWDASACTDAAGRGNLKCLEYLHEHGCPWDASACTDAAGRGNLKCLQYLHEHGCPWDAKTCDAAARRDHLDCLKYAHQHGCPIADDTVEAAVTGYTKWRASFRYILEHCAPAVLRTLLEEAEAENTEDSGLEASDMED